MLPIADEPLVGTPGRRPRLRPHLHGRGRARRRRRAAVHRPRHQPVRRCSSTSSSPSPSLGWALGINPFDQPNVQEAKDNTNKVLAEQPDAPEDGDLADAAPTASSRRTTSRSWATCPTTTPIDEAVARLRAQLIETYGVATTWGYGPRFLHSTGPVPQGRPADRALPAARPRRRHGRRHPRRGLRLPHADRRPGRRRPRRPCAATACPPSACASTPATSPGRSTRSPKVK